MAGRQPIVQHAEQPLVQIREWVTKRLKHLLGFDEVDGLVDNLMKLQSAEDTEKYVKDILGTERKAVQKFTEDLIQKRKDASPLFRTVAIRKPSAPNAQTDANVKVYRKKDETDPFMVKKKKPNKPKEQPQTAPQPAGGGQQPQGGQAKGKKGKGGKQTAADPLQLPGRAWCGCMAARHPLLGNCLWCGKIVCAQEGAGPCLFCGNPVGEAPGAGSSSLSKQETDEYDASLARAMEHKDKLLEYERTSARRTVIYDDQQDYFQTDGSQWLTPEQRKQMRKLEEERQKKRKEAKNKVSISFDFAGRRIMVEEGEDVNDAFYFEKADEISRGVLQNPTLRLPAPVFTSVDDRAKVKTKREKEADADAAPAGKAPGGSDKDAKSRDVAKGKAPAPTADHAAGKERDDDEYDRKLQHRTSKRVQHDYYAVDSEWTPEDEWTSSSSSSSSLSVSTAAANQRSFKFRGLCERVFDYSAIYPSSTFHQWGPDDRAEVIATLKKAGGLTSFLHVVDATAGQASSDADEVERVARMAEACEKEGVEFHYGLCFPAALFVSAQEKDKLRERVDKLRVVERMVALVARNCTRFAFFFDDSPAPHLPSATSPSAFMSGGGKTSLLSSLHAYVANHLLEETLKRVKQTQHARLKFHLLPLFYGKELRDTRSAGAKQGPSFGAQPKREQEPEMDRDVVQYWKEMDRNTKPQFTFLFSGFTSTEPRTKGGDASPSQQQQQIRFSQATDAAALGKLKQLVQQHKVVLLDTYPSLIPTFKSTAAVAASSSASASVASLLRSFPAVPHLQGYEGKHGVAAEWAEGMAVQVAPALLAPRAGLVPLLTAFDFMLAPITHDPSMALKSALLRLLQGEERLADDLLSLIDASPAPPSSSSLAIRRFKMKKLATPTFFQETSERVAYVRKSLAASPLGDELRPFFALLDAFLEMNAINFEVEAFFEKQKQKGDSAGADKKWDDFNDIKKRLTDAQRKLDLLLSPAYPLATLKENLRELNTAYLQG